VLTTENSSFKIKMYAFLRKIKEKRRKISLYPKLPKKELGNIGTDILSEYHKMFPKYTVMYMALRPDIANR